MITIQNFIRQHIKTVAPLHRKTALLFWKAATTGKSQYYQQYAQIEKTLATIYSDKKSFKLVKDFYQNKQSLNNPVHEREIESIYLTYLPKQAPKSIIRKLIDKGTQLEQKFNVFRAQYNNKTVTENDLREILQNSTTTNEVKEAWLSGKQVGKKVYKDILNLVKLRNQMANKLGYSDYYQFSLSLQEMDEKWLFTLLDQLEKKTNPLFKKTKKELDNKLAEEFGIKTTELMPWHYRDPFFQVYPKPRGSVIDQSLKTKSLEEITTEFYKGIGLDIQPILKKSDLYERKGKDQHAFCIGIDCPSDVRILCNIKPNTQWLETMLHEFGHGVYDKYLNPKLPFYLRGASHIMTTEAIALMMERMVGEKAFLVKYLGISPAKAVQISQLQKETTRNRLIVFTRWCLVMSHFERNLYQNPDQDLNGLWWKLVSQYQLLKTPPNRNESDWAAKIHIATVPVYYHNYLLGELFATQLLHAMKQDSGIQDKLLNNTKTGDFLVNKVFYPGASLRWDQLIEKATSEPLNPDYFINNLKN